jgi:dTDP-4-dehydrorhamnose reductase
LRILLTGCRGQVGSELAQLLPQAVATDRSTLDLGNPDAIRRAVREARPQIIINAAAYTAVDKAESERELSTKANAIAPGVLGEEAKRLGALLVHYSTDYVFDGEKRLPYSEDDRPNPLSHYARTKLEGERAIAATGCRHLILRTSWVYSPRAQNFFRVILQKARAGEPMRMVDDQTSVPTPAVFVARNTALLFEQEGLLHLVPSGEASRYDFARAVAGSRSKVERAKTADFPAPARRPAYSAMSNRRAAAALGAPIPDWRELLEECMKSWNPA